MITHRLGTQSPAPEPAVRFYKIIALTFLVITIALLGVVVFITSKKATVVIVAKEDTKNVNVNVKVAKEANKENTMAGLVSSVDFSWSEKYYPTGNKTVEGIATGEVVLYNKTNASQALVKTTRLLNPQGILFRLSDRVTVPANGQIVALVYADEVGPKSDIGSSTFTIPGLSEDKQKVIYAESTKAMTGGLSKVGVLSDQDLQVAEADYKEKVREAYKNSLKLNNESGVIISVLSQDASPTKKAGDEVSEFSLTGTSTIVVVSYDKDELSNILKREVAGKVDLTSEKVLSVTNEPKVSLLAYDLVAGTAEVAVSQDVKVTLDSSGEKLSLQNFLGKSKEEIERYVLSLDHVSGVDVKFSPAWTRKAPSVPDKIKVIVKNIK
ncbi:MAG TPA: hypothetical protein VJH75_02435 [Patescibacteria group bacterium]|nr:hypothetical protein [Patescibacteria group bacterium]